jgi:hypothetical protein
VCITAKKNANDESVAQLFAAVLPNFWAVKLIFSASGQPIDLNDFNTLLSINPSNFPKTTKILLAK